MQNTKTVKFRGIKTTSKKTNESSAKTITNRLGQKSLSLPRITDDKRWAGFPGLAGVARKIAKMVTKSNYFVEPFAGTAKVFQELDSEKYWKAILNDKSKFIYKWLKEEFLNAEITNDDFKESFKRWDSRHTFFMVDPPWFRSYYDQQFSIFDRYNPKEYYEEILKICENLQGKFIITSRKENNVMLSCGYKNKLVESEYVVSGKYPKVLVTTNL